MSVTVFRTLTCTPTTVVVDEAIFPRQGERRPDLGEDALDSAGVGG